MDSELFMCAMLSFIHTLAVFIQPFSSWNSRFFICLTLILGSHLDNSALPLTKKKKILQREILTALNFFCLILFRPTHTIGHDFIFLWKLTLGLGWHKGQRTKKCQKK